MKSSKLFLLLFVVIATSEISAQMHDKAPIMGWASWNYFSVNINDSIIKAQTDALVSSGLAAAGYQYINIDDGFFDNRNDDGTLKIDSVKFPNGMDSLVNYIHSKGLKAGFYSDAGVHTCGSQYNNQTGGSNGGMYDHDQQDADLFFKTWDFDFLKVDYCGGLTAKMDEKERYTAIKKAIDNTGKEVNFNACRWQFPGSWITDVADSWRIAADITLDQYVKWSDVVRVIDKNKYLAAYASRGHYNDMDMIPIGRGLTGDEDKSMFAMWCIMSSPLVLGNDLSNMTQQTIDLVTNEELIAINQDTTGMQAQLAAIPATDLEVWSKPLNGKQSNERAVVLFNRTSTAASMTVSWNEINLDGPAVVRNLLEHTDLGTMDAGYTTMVPAHGVTVLKVIGNARLKKTFEAEYSWINNFNITKNSTVVADQGRAVTNTSCSGGACAGWIGNSADNYIEWRDIYVTSPGYYPCTLTYKSGENRNATISVNGVDTTLTNLNSGGWSTFTDISFPVQLQKGYNTIRISNQSGWLPDIDKIEFDFSGISAGIINASKENNKNIFVTKSGQNSMLNIDMDQNTTSMSVTLFDVSGKQCLLKNTVSAPAHIDVSALNKGFYIVLCSDKSNTYTQKVFIQ